MYWVIYELIVLNIVGFWMLEGDRARSTNRNERIFVQLKKGENSEHCCYIIPGIWPHKPKAYEGILRDFRGDVYLLQEYGSWYFENVMDNLTKHANSHGYSDIEIIEISLGTHAGHPQSCHSFIYRLFYLNPCRCDYIVNIPLWVQLFTGYLAISLYATLGFLNLLPIVYIGKKWRSIGFCLTRTADCFLNKTLKTHGVGGVILSFRDQFFRGSGNASFRKDFKRSKVVEINTKHADLKENSLKYCESLKELGFYD